MNYSVLLEVLYYIYIVSGGLLVGATACFLMKRKFKGKFIVFILCVLVLFELFFISYMSPYK
jgi:hypothetical protein